MLNSYCAVYGDAAVAAMSIVNRIAFFAFSVAIGIGQGFQPVSGFNYGAKKYRRLRKAIAFTVEASMVIMIFGSAILFVFADRLIGLFRDDPEVIATGVRALRLQSLAQLTLPPCMAVEMLYQSTGKRLGASLLSSLRNGILFIPALMILSRYRGLSGIQEAQPVTLLFSLPVAIVFGLIFFRKLPKEDIPDSGGDAQGETAPST